MWLRKNYLCDFQRQTFDKNDIENILTKKVTHEPVLKTRNCILFIAFEYISFFILLSLLLFYSEKMRLDNSYRSSAG